MLNTTIPTSRRSFLGIMGASLGAAALRGHTVKASDTVHFTHGVASGDPLQDRVILWSRVIPGSGEAKNLKVAWQVASDDNFSAIVSEGSATAAVSRDHIVKVDADGLKPGTIYYYRFICDGVTSPAGRTRSLPADGTKHARMAVISCSNYPQGYFNVYRELANRDVEVVLHLGDYIYEYATGIYSNDAAVAKGRAVTPKNECLALEDYRERYGLYRSDPDLQAAHAAHPFICVWDDHEIANNSWKDGAENHNAGEGSYAERKKAAIRAYHEWLPVRETTTGQTIIRRSFNYGGLASLIMLDTRIEGRDAQLSYETDLPYRTLPFDMRDASKPKALLSAEAMQDVPPDAIRDIPVPFDLRGEKPQPMTDLAEIKKLDPKKLPSGFSYLPDGEKFRSDILGDKTRTILGKEQEDWITAELQVSKDAGVPWQVFGQQLLIGKVPMPYLRDEDLDFSDPAYISKERFKAAQMIAQLQLPFNLDFWDGYPACRTRIFESIKVHANNAVFLAGDTHNAWAFNLADEDGNAVAVEFGTPSISSPGLETYIPAQPATVKTALKKTSPELQYIDSEHRGWLELDLTPERATSTWYFVSTVLEQEYTVTEGQTVETRAGSHRLN
ncbi:alkaline phosphatase D family protein [Kordiimonas aestuarii]|uniref:alkaline phosphatase D family protein n=1 Tax=Kordiimonas aestuarii TaxID=1005925 RepID=UPI0021CFA363|nr:alkaline phosphatase D family protein [Kordiimonas aestuarii]